MPMVIVMETILVHKCLLFSSLGSCGWALSGLSFIIAVASIYLHARIQNGKLETDSSVLLCYHLNCFRFTSGVFFGMENI